MLVDGPHVVVLAKEGLFVFDKAKPTVLWQDKVQSPQEARILRDSVVVLERHEIRALRRQDGKPVWRRAIPPAMQQDGFFGFSVDADKDLIEFQADFSVRPMPGVRLSTGKPLRARDIPEPEESEGEVDMSGPYGTRKDTETRDGLFAVVEMEDGILAGVDLRQDPSQSLCLPPASSPPQWKPPAARDEPTKE